MSWKLLELSYSYRCLHGSSPSDSNKTVVLVWREKEGDLLSPMS